MTITLDLRPPLAPPLPFQLRSNDEYAPVPLGERDRRALDRVLRTGFPAARRLGMDAAEYFAGRTGTAAALLAIDEQWATQADGDDGFFDVPPEADRDPEAAREALGGDETIVDVQTHYVARERCDDPAAEAILAFIRSVAPDRWRDLPGGRGGIGLSLAEYLRCVFLESETAVAVLTSAPGEGEKNILTNAEIAGTRELLDRLAGRGRLLHHAIVHPNVPGELEAMESLRSRYRPAGWKVYTLYGRRSPGGSPGGSPGEDGAPWMLDDERTGVPFLERTRELGVGIVCAHKGLSALIAAGSPRDVGPAAAAFPEIDLLVYHSGYETGGDEEGPHPEPVPADRLAGSDRLVRSLRDAGVAPGRNVYAELGSTFFALLRRPREAAHVLGKLLLAVGEDNLLWGTDSIWYGSPQPLIDAFRAFRIPQSYQDRWGYPALTPAVKRKVLGENAARVYGIDLAAAARSAREDDLAWVRQALAHHRDHGTPRL